MKKYTLIFPFFFGLLFSLGLGISGMMSPQKVQGFLDIAGNWDSDLLWVLGGAVSVTFLLFPKVIQRTKPYFHDMFALPTKKNIDISLIGGSVLFGIGWALSGMCPGPALANILSGNSAVLVFVATMLSVFFIFERFRS